MVYTKQQHMTLRSQVQELFYLIKEITHSDLTANDGSFLLGVIRDGGLFEIQHTAPLEGIGFFTLCWGLFPYGDSSLRLQYSTESGDISDSTTFDSDGEYQHGHIQMWHSLPHVLEGSVLDWLVLKLKSVNMWVKLDMQDSVLLAAMPE